MAIFPGGIPYSLQKPENPSCRQLDSLRVALAALDVRAVRYTRRLQPITGRPGESASVQCRGVRTLFFLTPHPILFSKF